MSYSDDFNKNSESSEFSFKAEKPFTLEMRRKLPGSYYSEVYSFDFFTRMMKYKDASSQAIVTIIGFSQLDVELLQGLRQILIDKGGNPPELPAPAGARFKIGKELG